MLSLPWFDRLNNSRRRLMQWGVILLVLLSSVALALYYGKVGNPLSISGLLPFLAILGLDALLIFSRWPQLGLLAVIVGGLVIPFGIGTGSQSSLNMAVLLLLLMSGLWLIEMIVNRRFDVGALRPVRPLLFFGGVALLAFAVGSQPWLWGAHTAPLRAQVGGLMILLLGPAALLLVGHYITDSRWLQRLTYIFVALASVYILGRIAPPLVRLTGFFPEGVTGSLFWTWLIALSFSQAVYNQRLHLAGRILLGVAAAGAMFVGLVLARDWSSGWIPAVIALAVIMWAAQPRLGFLFAVLGVAVIAVKLQSILGFVLTSDNQYSLTTRLAAWRVLFQIIGANPILGLGPANYHYYTTLFPILGYRVQFNSHNNYMDILAQTGVLGLACFAWFAAEIGRLGWGLRTQAQPGFDRAYVLGALGGLAGTLTAGMFGDWVLPFAYNVGMNGFRASVLGWLFLGGLLSIARRVKQPSHAAEAAAPTP